MSSSVVAVRRCLSAVLMLAHLGCTSWRVQTAPPAEVLARRQGGETRILLADSTTITLRDPQMQRDSIVGYALQGAYASRSDRRRAIPLDSILQMETRVPSWGKTAALTAGVLVGVAAVAVGGFLIWCQSNRCFD